MNHIKDLISFESYSESIIIIVIIKGGEGGENILFVFETLIYTLISILVFISIFKVSIIGFDL